MKSVYRLERILQSYVCTFLNAPAPCMFLLFGKFHYWMFKSKEYRSFVWIVVLIMKTLASMSGSHEIAGKLSVCVCVSAFISLLCSWSWALWATSFINSHSKKSLHWGHLCFIVVWFCQVCVVIGSNESSFAEEPSFPHPLSLGWNLKAHAEFKSSFTSKWKKMKAANLWGMFPCMVCWSVDTQMH